MIANLTTDLARVRADVRRLLEIQRVTAEGGNLAHSFRATDPVTDAEIQLVMALLERAPHLLELMDAALQSGISYEATDHIVAAYAAALPKEDA